jgi:catechol 2,3-dioxygenase-like lactoylglutathione lyase family enzyme
MIATVSKRLNHIGIGVPNIEEAVNWYQDVLGLRLISGPKLVTREASPQAVNVLGQSFGKMRIAHMVGDDAVGFELFELIDPSHERRPDPVEFWKNGIFHLCITDHDIEGITRRIVGTGGTQLSEIWFERPPSTERRMVYCADPFGTVIEVYTHPYELMQGEP